MPAIVAKVPMDEATTEAMRLLHHALDLLELEDQGYTLPKLVLLEAGIRLRYGKVSIEERRADPAFAQALNHRRIAYRVLGLGPEHTATGYLLGPPPQ